MATNSTLEEELLTEVLSPHLYRQETSLPISRLERKDGEKYTSSVFPCYLMLLQIFLQMKNIFQCSSNHLPPVLQEILFVRAQLKPQTGI